MNIYPFTYMCKNIFKLILWGLERCKWPLKWKKPENEGINTSYYFLPAFLRSMSHIPNRGRPFHITSVFINSIISFLPAVIQLYAKVFALREGTPYCTQGLKTEGLCQGDYKDPPSGRRFAEVLEHWAFVFQSFYKFKGSRKSSSL